MRQPSGQHPHRKRRGFLFADALVALALMAALAVALLSVKGAYARVERKLANQREADRMAETTLVDLQRGQPASESAQVVGLDTLAPAGWRWVRVELSYNGRVGRISGLVRRAS